MQEKARVFVGIDPGTTYGIALVDFKGNIAYTASIKNSSKEEAVRIIMEHGKPAAIATDKVPVPDTVEKIGAIMNVPVYSPGSSMLLEYKAKLAENIEGDAHQKDSAAAAIWLYRRFENKFRKIDAIDMNEQEKEEAKERAVRGRAVHQEEQEEEMHKEKRDGARRAEEYVKYLEKAKDRKDAEINELKRQIKGMEHKMKEQEEEIIRMRRKMSSELFKDHAVRAMKGKIERMQAALAKAGRKKMKIKQNENEQKDREEKNEAYLKNLLSKVVNEYRYKR